MKSGTNMSLLNAAVNMHRLESTYHDSSSSNDDTEGTGCTAATAFEQYKLTSKLNVKAHMIILTGNIVYVVLYT